MVYGNPFNDKCLQLITKLSWCPPNNTVITKHKIDVETQKPLMDKLKPANASPKFMELAMVSLGFRVLFIGIFYNIITLHLPLHRKTCPTTTSTTRIRVGKSKPTAI